MDGLFATFLNGLITLLFCMMVGYIGRKGKIINDEMVTGLSALLVKITLPCTVFVSMLRPFSQTLLQESIATFFLAVAVYLFGGFLAVFLAKIMNAGPDEKRCWQFGLIFANVGYMGIPLTQAVFGSEAMIYTAMANASFNILLFTVGIKLFNPIQKKENKLESVKMLALNPALLMTMAGFICFITSFRLPVSLNEGISMIGSITTPISMLLVGAIAAKSRILSLFNDWRVLPVIAFRLVIIPLAAFYILKSFIYNPVMLGVIVILSAMPMAAITAIFAEQYKSDAALASKLVALSTLLCVATIPLISLLL